jgi:hypothetical protein
MRNLLFSVGLLSASALMAQGPMYDKVQVNLPYPVTVNNTTLQPGDYVIRQHESGGGGSRVLQFFSDQGMKLETTAVAIPALDNRTPEQTKLILDHIGNDYYLNKIWVQGKDYGYEFPIPSEIRMREQERNAPANVVARYEPAPAERTVVAETRTETETVTRPAQPEPEPAPAPPPQEVAQNRPEPIPEPTPAPPAASPAPAPQQYADQAPAMPHTAANWLNMLLGGALLACSGLALSRVRA